MKRFSLLEAIVSVFPNKRKKLKVVKYGKANEEILASRTQKKEPQLHVKCNVLASLPLKSVTLAQ